MLAKKDGGVYNYVYRKGDDIVEVVYIVCAVVGGVIALVLFAAWICFRLAFLAVRRAKSNAEEYSIPDGEIYEPFRETMVAWMKEVRAMPYEAMSVVSFDGLTLRGKYYEYAPGAPIELMFHGYRGSAERDLCGGVQRCFALKRNVLLVDQRSCGDSDGRVITFGIHERRDCLAWIECIRFGDDAKIILTGISMGAATVLMAAAEPLPEMVIGVLADCGYTSARDIIQKVIKQMKLPAGLLYPFVKCGAKLYGGFDLEETSPLQAMRTCRVPVLFIHGENDDFVPCEMSVRNYETCTTRKQLFTVPGAGHGLSYLLQPQMYLAVLKDFFG